MKSCKEMAKQWGVTERTVTTFCKTGKIPGVVKEGKSWRIPDGAEKPADGRVLSGKYVKKEEKEARKPLPIGISDYVRAQSEYYYVDKTGMIKEFLDRKPLVSLFTRPRRFGKTLKKVRNVSMQRNIWCIQRNGIRPGLILISAFPKCHPISDGRQSSMRLGVYLLIGRVWNSGKQRGRKRESRI